MEGLLASVHVLVVLQRCCVSISVLVQQLGICVGESGESMSMSIPARIKGSRLSKAVKFIFASYSSCMQYSTPSRSPVLMTDTACHKWCVCMCVQVMNVRMYVHVCVCNVTFSMHIMSGMEWSVPPLAHQEWNGIEYDLTCTSQWNGME